MPTTSLRAGLTARRTYEVTPADTAAALGSGDTDVLATPRLLAWMEAATCAAVADALGPGETSVGTRVTLEHLKASPVAARVAVEASLQHADGRLIRFEVVASDDVDAGGPILGRAEVTRVVVDRDRFLARLS
jgi:fluoroacetyl-CoA thioesterase